MRTLESHSRREGTGLQAENLAGTWQVRRIWAKGRQNPSWASGALLQTLAATLSITASEEGQEGQLTLCNSVGLGACHLRFLGPGNLEQKRPLLVFRFLEMQVVLGGKILFRRALPEPRPREQPFFALIALHTDEQGTSWLAARGRGGGLALWVREDR